MIDVSELRFSYGGREVLKGVSFHVERGTVNFILGANGAGKTTMFRCLLGLMDGYGGEIRMEGLDIRKLAPAKMARLVAYIPQAHTSVFAYTALDMTLMGTGRSLSPFASPGKKEVAIAMAALKRVGVEHLADRPVQSLSGGEQQLVMIARALAQKADILIMDEPTSSLDYGNQLRILSDIRELSREGYTVVISSHNPQHALTFADSVAAIRSGVVTAFGKPEDVVTEALLRELYGVNVRLVHSNYGVALVPETSSTERKVL